MSVAALRSAYRSADAAYRAGKPVMSDVQFDALAATLKAAAPHAPELQTPGGGTALLSLDNAPLDEWWPTIKGASVVVQPKIDGVAIALRYEAGTLTAAWTRSGKCAMHLLSLVADVPHTLNRRLDVEVRGELWAFDHKQSTPAAALRRKIPNATGLGFTAYTLLNTPCETELDALSLLHLLGFATVTAIHCHFDDEVQALHTIWRQSKPALWPTDGLVVRVNNLTTQSLLGSNSIAPNWALALKS